MAMRNLRQTDPDSFYNGTICLGKRVMGLECTPVGIEALNNAIVPILHNRGVMLSSKQAQAADENAAGFNYMAGALGSVVGVATAIAATAAYRSCTSKVVSPNMEALL